MFRWTKVEVSRLLRSVRVLQTAPTRLMGGNRLKIPAVWGPVSKRRWFVAKYAVDVSAFFFHQHASAFNAVRRCSGGRFNILSSQRTDD